MSIFDKKDSIDGFWKWFKRKENYIYEKLEIETEAIVEELTNELHKIHDDLAFEISFEKEEDKRNFVISADGIKSLFDTVIDLTNRAPSFDRWNIVPFRPRLHQQNQVIELEGISLDYDDIYFMYIEDDEQDMIHLDVFVMGYDGEDNRYIHIYFILLDSLVGEYDAVTKIGDTVMYPMPEESDLTFYEFRDLISILDGLDKTDKVN